MLTLRNRVPATSARVPAILAGHQAASAPRQQLRTRPGATFLADRAVPDVRRRLQLVLGGLWLLDGVLQFQPAMFTPAFPRMLAATAAGNPALIAGPVIWSARLIGQHAAAMNAVFATVQVLLGLGIIWRRTVRPALAASVAWALGVWWLGEGLGALLTGAASPVSGAPGAVILYALLEVLLWPAEQDRPAPFVAGRVVGAPAARGLWLILWGALAYLALQPAVRAPQAISGLISAAAPGQPGWLAWIINHFASALSHRGLLASVLLAAALAAVAASACLPAGAARLARAAVLLAVLLGAAIWVAEGLGAIFTGSATDPNSGPLLALFACAYWPGPLTGPRLRPGQPGGRAAAGSRPAEPPPSTAG